MAKVIRFPSSNCCKTLQVVELPPHPTREAIFEAYKDGCSGPQIAERLRVTKEQIRRVLWAYAEINDRAKTIARGYKPQLTSMIREIEYEVWREAEDGGPLSPPPVGAERMAA